jgi:hypothetical protein
VRLLASHNVSKANMGNITRLNSIIASRCKPGGHSELAKDCLVRSSLCSYGTVAENRWVSMSQVLCASYIREDITLPESCLSYQQFHHRPDIQLP